MAKSKMNRRKTASATDPGRVPVGASLTVADVTRLDAYGERMSREQGLEAKRGTLALMLIRKGLDAAEAEAS